MNAVAFPAPLMWFQTECNRTIISPRKTRQRARLATLMADGSAEAEVRAPPARNGDLAHMPSHQSPSGGERGPEGCWETARNGFPSPLEPWTLHCATSSVPQSVPKRGLIVNTKSHYCATLVLPRSAGRRPESHGG